MDSKRDQLVKILSEKRSDSRIVYLIVGADKHLEGELPKMFDLFFSQDIPDKKILLPNIKAYFDAEECKDFPEYDDEQLMIYSEAEDKAIATEKIERRLKRLSPRIEVILTSYTYDDLDLLTNAHLLKRSELIPTHEIYALKLPKDQIIDNKLTLHPYFEKSFIDYETGEKYFNRNVFKNTEIGRCTFFAINPSILKSKLIYSNHLAWDSDLNILYRHKDYSTTKQINLTTKRQLKRYINTLFRNINKPTTEKHFKDNCQATDTNSITTSISKLRRMIIDELKLSEKHTFDSIQTLWDGSYILN